MGSQHYLYRALKWRTARARISELALKSRKPSFKSVTSSAEEFMTTSCSLGSIRTPILTWLSPFH